MRNILVGAGDTARQLLNFYNEIIGNELGESLLAIFDNDLNKWGNKLGKLTIYPLSEIEKFGYDRIIIASIYKKSIVNQLKEMKINCNKIIDSDKFKRELFAINQKKMYEEKHSKIEEQNNNCFSLNKLVVYTAIFGNYDELNEPDVVNSDIDYICFTDNPNLVSANWKIKLVKRKQSDSVLESRMYKLLPHKLFNAEYSLWMDANLKIKGNLLSFVKENIKDKEILLIPHFERDCLYEEGGKCICNHRDNAFDIINQLKVYLDRGCPQHVGLYCGGVLARKHGTENMIRFDELWWQHFQKFSKRDQISLSYLIWKEDLNISLCGIDCIDNEWFSLKEHLKY